ncbi:glutathione transferase GstA, partial [Salmonella enterica]
WLLGETYSLLDPYLFLMTRWGRSMARPPRTLPAIGRHAAAVHARPAVREAVAIEQLPEPVC